MRGNAEVILRVMRRGRGGRASAGCVGSVAQQPRAETKHPPRCSHSDSSAPSDTALPQNTTATRVGSNWSTTLAACGGNRGCKNRDGVTTPGLADVRLLSSTGPALEDDPQPILAGRRYITRWKHPKHAQKDAGSGRRARATGDFMRLWRGLTPVSGAREDL